MTMRVLLGLTILGIVLVTVGLLGLYVNVTHRLNKLQRELKAFNRDIRKNHNEIKVLKERAAQESDRIVITHEYKPADISYPSQEV